MTSVTATDVELVLGLVAIIGILVVVVLAVRKGSPTKAKITVGEIFHAEVEVGTAERAAAIEAVRKAAEQKGGTDATPGAQAIDRTTVARLARVLWVDDNPDCNLYETVALERLGLFVTKATSTEAGEFFLRELPISIVVTDVVRGKDQEAGKTLLAKVKSSHPELPVIFYTTGAEMKRAALVAAGAAAVVDVPGDLIAAVVQQRTR